MHTTLVRRTAKAIALITLTGALLAGLAAPASAGRYTPSIAAMQNQSQLSCGTNNQVSVTLAREPVTASGRAGWSYSVFFSGDYRQPWTTSNWTAAYANAGYATHWELANGAWRSLGLGSIDVSLPPHYSTPHVWQLRYEVVNGQWSTEWIYLGSCTAPPA
jgi:hypothetical protein